MIHRVRPSLTSQFILIVFALVACQQSYAAPTPAEISARIFALSGLTLDGISEVYTVEQSPKVVLLAAKNNVPVITEARTAYLLIRNATTGAWIRVSIDLAEWDTDFRPFFDVNSFEVLRQPYGSSDLPTSVEAANLADIATMAAVTVANLMKNGAMSWVNYDYDALGRLETVTFPDGKVVTYDYDANGNRLLLMISESN